MTTHAHNGTSRSVIVIGIDPGLDGGIAVLDGSGAIVALGVMPVLAGRRREVDAGELASHLYRVESEIGPPTLAVVERVHAMPRQGVSSSFSFGTGYGLVLGVLAALRVPVELATPQTWKRVVLAGTAQDKAAAVAYCARRWPGQSLVVGRGRVPRDGLADALCLAEFGRRQIVGREGASPRLRRPRDAG